MIPQLEKLLGTPRDNALLRYSLGLEYTKAGDNDKAVQYLRDAVERDPHYSAAWKVLGKTLAAMGKAEDALRAFEQGIAAAQKKGDRQAEKEMTVFAKRLRKQPG